MYGRLGGICILFLYWLGAAHVSAGVTYDAYATYDGTIANGRFHAKYVVRETHDTGLKTYKRTEALYPAARSKALAIAGLRQAKNAGIGAAVTAAVAAAGWAIDELTGQVTGPGGGTEDDSYEDGKYWIASGFTSVYGDFYGRTAHEACEGYVSNIPAYVEVIGLSPISATAQHCVLRKTSGNTAKQPVYKADCLLLPSSHCNAPVVEISDADFIDLLNDVLSNQDIQDLLTDENGNPILTPELIDAMNTLANPNADPNNQNEVKTEQPEGQEHAEFCRQKINAGHPLCDTAETPEVQPIPTTNVEMVDWDSGLGSGSCPSPRTTSFQGKSISYDYSTACGAISSFIRPITIAGAVLASAFILVGVRV